MGDITIGDRKLIAQAQINSQTSIPAELELLGIQIRLALAWSFKVEVYLGTCKISDPQTV